MPEVPPFPSPALVRCVTISWRSPRRYSSGTPASRDHDPGSRPLFAYRSLNGDCMQSRTGIRRVVIVVLDGLRPDAIDRYELRHVEHLMSTVIPIPVYI